MTNEDNLYLEIKNQGNFIRIETLNLVYSNSDVDYDNNWINCNVYVKGGVFSGSYSINMLTLDFETLKHKLNSLYENLNGAIEFRDLEGHIDMKIKGDGIGHFNCEVSCYDFLGVYSANLNFEIDFDQTFIKAMVVQLNEITKRFPIKGSFRIKNNYKI